MIMSWQFIRGEFMLLFAAGSPGREDGAGGRRALCHQHSARIHGLPRAAEERGRGSAVR